MRKLILITTLIAALLLTSCVSTQRARIEQAYQSGQISAVEYLQLTNELEIQAQQNQTAWGQAWLNYNAQRRPRTHNVYIYRGLGR